MITVEYYNKLINKNFNIKYCTPIIIEKNIKKSVQKLS